MVDAVASSGSNGAGQQDPATSNSDFTVAAFIVRQMMAELETMKLVQVVGVTGGGNAIARAGTVDVQLLVSQIDGAANSSPHGVVYGVPWWRLQGGVNAIICDPVKGDIGYIICADRDGSNVKAAIAAGKSPQAAPGSFRKFSVADGVYVGGALNDVPKQYLAFTVDGLALVDQSGNSIKTAAAGITATDSSGNVISTGSSGITLSPASGMPCIVNGILVVNGNLELSGSVLGSTGGRYAGTISTSGDIVAGTISVKSHTHTQPNDSRGDVEAPTSAPVP